MTTEQEKAAKEWAARYHVMASEIATASYIAGWNYALESLADSRTGDRQAAEQVGRAIEKQCSRAEIMGRAYEAFRDGRDETARLYRDLANELFGAPEPQSPLF